MPIYQTATWRFETSEDYAETISFRRPGYTYGRGYGNPTVEAFEGVMADLEGTAAAYAFASGMAAIHSVVTTLARSGHRVVTSRQLYGGAYSLFTKVLPRYGIEVTFVDAHDLGDIEAALPGAALFYVETIANPTMSVVDLEAIGGMCADAGIPAVVDNTFASPYLCNPAAMGFSHVVHSTTKYVGGHHDLVGGVACTNEDGRRALRETAIDVGDAMEPLIAWLCLRGVSTLALRVERQCETAQRLAEFLVSHPAVEAVHYPGLPTHPDHDVAKRILSGFGGMLAFDVAGGVEGGKRFCDALELAWVATSLGGHTTLVGHAASTTHRQYSREDRIAAGIADGLVRVSTGLEDADDLIADFAQALGRT